MQLDLLCYIDTFSVGAYSWDKINSQAGGEYFQFSFTLLSSVIKKEELEEDVAFNVAGVNYLSFSSWFSFDKRPSR